MESVDGYGGAKEELALFAPYNYTTSLSRSGISWLVTSARWPIGSGRNVGGASTASGNVGGRRTVC